MLHRKLSLFVFCFFFACDAMGAPTLEEKLDAQWQRYSEARNLVLANVQNGSLPLEKRIVSRSDWEKLLNPGNETSLLSSDIAQLRASQSVRIQNAKQLAIQQSTIDLEQLRALPVAVRSREISSFCAALPKGGMLHVHPSGTFSRQTVDRMLNEHDPVLKFQSMLKDISNTHGNSMLYPEESGWLSSLGADRVFSKLTSAEKVHYEEFSFLPPGKQPFSRFNSAFEFLDPVVPEWKDYEEALTDFAQRAVAEGVTYVEFTTGVEPELIGIVQRLEARTGLTIRLNRSFNRTASIVDIDAKLQKSLKEPEDSHLVGIDFLDDETAHPALEKGQMLYGTVLSEVLAGRSHLHRTMHAGEIGDVRNPRDAMILGAERLGHGVLLNQDAVALEYAATHHIAVEVNISSNLRLTSVEKASTHPYLNYLRLGVPVSMSTDDEGIFDIDINHECEVAIGETDVTYAELKNDGDELHLHILCKCIGQDRPD